MHPGVSWSHGIYHKGVGEEDKTRGGMRSTNEKGPATIAGPLKTPP